MAQEAHAEFFEVHSGTVIADPNEVPPRVPKLNINLSRPRIERVFEKLFDGSRGAFQNFTRRNLIDRGGIEELNSGSGLRFYNVNCELFSLKTP
jgi:hypothetical protein